VAGVVQLYAQDGPHGLGITDEEIDVLAIDAVHPASVLAIVSGPGIEQVAEGDLGADGSVLADDVPQDVIEADLGWREKVVAQVIREGGLRLGFRFRFGLGG
jgi:hypothetical protein